MSKEITVPTSGAIITYQILTDDYNEWTVHNTSGLTVKYHNETSTKSISGNGQDDFKVVFPKLESTTAAPYLQSAVTFPMNVEITSGACEGTLEEVDFKQAPYYTLTFNGNPNSEGYDLKLNDVKLNNDILYGEFTRQFGCTDEIQNLKVYNDDTSEKSGLTYNKDSSFSGYVYPGYPIISDFDFIISGTTDEICNPSFVFCDTDGDGFIYPICEFIETPNTYSAYTFNTITKEINHDLKTTNEEPLSVFDNNNIVNSTITSAIHNDYLIESDNGYYISPTAQGHDFTISGQTSIYVPSTDYKIFVHII